MKRLLLFAALLTATVFSAHAYDFSAVAPSGQTLYYNIVNGNAEVVCPGTIWYNPYGGYTEPSGSLVIPSSVTYGGQTYSVTSIGTSAFCECDGLINVTIPEGVTHIGDAAFLACTGLSSPLIIPNTVTSIETNAFNGCSSLTSVRLGSGIVTMGNETFRNCISLTALYCLSQYPPSIGNYVFDGVNSNFNIYVPCQFYQNYLNNWSNYGTILCSFQFNLIVSSNDSTWGTGSYIGLSDSIAEITATANYGYHFDHWSYGSTANPDTIMLTDDATITAIFAKNQYSVTGTTNDSTKGLVSGSATVDYLDTVTLTATANYGYQFVRWSDYSTENPRRIAATANITKIAIFDFNQYNLTVHADTSIHGYCNGGGSYNHLSERTISANANYGYHFTQWNDGNTDNPRVITLTQDTSFTAMFAKNQYTLTVSSNDTTLGRVAGSGTYEYLDTIAISATAIEHYHFVRWDDGNTLNPRNIIMTSDISRSAIFAIDTHSVTLQAGNITHGSYSGNGQYQYGTAATVEAQPYSGYLFSHWSNGSTYNPYTFAVVDNVQLTAHFYAVGSPYQDTLYLDTLVVNNTVYVHDTSYMDRYVHDTTYINVPVHDTTYSTVFVHDTTYQDVYVYDTVYYAVHDTMYLNANTNDTCAITEFPYTMDFNDGASCWWLMDWNNDGYNWGIYSNNGVDGSACAAAQYSVNADDWFMTPWIVMYGTFTVSWKTRVWNSNYPETYQVIKLRSDNTYDTLFSETLTSTSYVDRSVNFSIPVGSLERIAFRYLSDDMYYLLIDDVVINQGNTEHVHDTTYINVPYPVHDTTIVTLTDTIINTVFDTIDNYIFDTTLVTVTDTLWMTLHDTLWLHDTIYLPQYIHDTVYIHDTIYITQEGIDSVDMLNAKIYISNGQIVVEGAEGNNVWLYDAIGRLLATKQDDYTPLRFDAPATGTYLIKIGNHPARRVVVIR